MSEGWNTIESDAVCGFFSFSVEYSCVLVYHLLHPAFPFEASFFWFALSNYRENSNTLALNMSLSLFSLQVGLSESCVRWSSCTTPDYGSFSHQGESDWRSCFSCEAQEKLRFDEV